MPISCWALCSKSTVEDMLGLSARRKMAQLWRGLRNRAALARKYGAALPNCASDLRQRSERGEKRCARLSRFKAAIRPANPFRRVRFPFSPAEGALCVDYNDYLECNASTYRTVGRLLCGVLACDVFHDKLICTNVQYRAKPSIYCGLPRINQCAYQLSAMHRVVLSV